MPPRLRSLLALTQPRDEGSAARVLAVLSAVAGAVTLVFAPLSPGADAGSIGLTVGIGLVVLVFAGWLWRRGHLPPPAWSLVPYLALGCITLDDLLTLDAGVSAQVFLLFPVLFAGKCLRRPAAIAATLAAMAAEVAVVLAQLPVQVALVPVGYVGAAMGATAGVLILAAERQERLTALLRRQAAVDPLTGLATRTVLDQAAVSALSGAASSHGTSLVLLDIDSFKQINDTHGHPGGDQVLIQLARLLDRRCRFGDVVSRLGGDEIAVLLPGCSVSDTVRRAEQFMADIRAHAFDVGGDTPLSLSVSVGLAHAPSHATDLRGLYAAADEALYSAKRNGKDRIASAVSH